MTRLAAIARCCAGLVLAASGLHGTVFAAAVDEIPGLQAWFKTDSLHATLRNGDTVSRWPDSSGSGRDLTSDGNGSPAIFEVKQIGDHAVVRAGRANSFSVASPLELDDHTVFLVYETARARLGLFDGGVPDQAENGIVLREDASRDVCRLGSAAAPYGRDVEFGAGFHITMLGRKSGGLHAFVDGKDLSAGRAVVGKLRVGRLFELRQTRYVTFDGLGLRVAEMMFYDRYLNDDERSVVTRYLSEKYGIGLAPQIGAVLGTTLAGVVPPDGHRIRWDEQIELHPPLIHDAQGTRSRLFCARDGTRVRLSVTLAVSANTPGSGLRVLILKNGTEYADDVAESGPMTANAATVELRATLTLNDGDYIEIVAFAARGNGSVTVEPGGARSEPRSFPDPPTLARLPTRASRRSSGAPQPHPARPGSVLRQDRLQPDRAPHEELELYRVEEDLVLREAPSAAGLQLNPRHLVARVDPLEPQLAAVAVHLRP